MHMGSSASAPPGATPRRAVTLRLNGDLLARARARGLDLSAIAEAAIGRAVAERESAWLRAEIARSLVQYEAYLAEYGSFAEAVRADAQARDDDGEDAGFSR
jgi:post-segregation antitoxin (ccd killing protein)